MALVEEDDFPIVIQGAFPGLAVKSVDVDNVRGAERAVEHLAFHDRLTGLPNRAHFEGRLDAALTGVQAGGRTTAAALLFLDIDRFKHVNDTMGHDAGDELLREVAQRLRRAARSNDVAARLAGDEFVVLLTDLPVPGAAETAGRVAHRVLEALAEPYALGGGAPFSTTASIGVAVYPDDAVDAAGLLKAADTGMYASKRSGKGRVSAFGDCADAA